jgi:hypothetical protein
VSFVVSTLFQELLHQVAANLIAGGSSSLKLRNGFFSSALAAEKFGKSYTQPWRLNLGPLFG